MDSQVIGPVGSSFRLILRDFLHPEQAITSQIISINNAYVI